MRNKLKKLYTVTLLLGFIAIAVIGLVTWFFVTDLRNLIMPKTSEGIIAIAAYIFLLVFYHFSMFSIFAQFRYLKRFKALKITSLSLVIIALISLPVDKVMAGKIKDSLAMGWEPDEKIILFISLIFKILVQLVLLVNFYILFIRRNYARENSLALKDQTIFMLTQSLGLATGLLGLYLVIRQVINQIAFDQFLSQAPSFLFVLVPYLAAIVYWLSVKWRGKFSQWYDEKQKRDIYKSGFYTLLLAVPGLAVLLLIGGGISFYWYPFFLFFILAVFSGMTLIRFKSF
jgi:hypothetical protein